jgi:putative solute:sodium symporter small subunit
MIEIGLGVIVIALALAILTGAANALSLPVPDLFPLLGIGGTAAIFATGLLSAVHGAYRRLLKRRIAGRHAFRSTGLMLTSLLMVALVAFAVPQLVEPLNIIKLAGFPAGFYAAAQGALIVLVIIAFIVAARQEEIDRQDGTRGG